MSVWWLKICAACQAPFSLSKHSIRWSFARIYFKISWAYMIHVQNPFCVWVFRQRDVVQMCFRLAEQHAIAACWGACPCTHEEPVFLSFAVSPPTKTKRQQSHTPRGRIPHLRPSPPQHRPHGPAMRASMKGTGPATLALSLRTPTTICCPQSNLYASCTRACSPWQDPTLGCLQFNKLGVICTCVTTLIQRYI